ncbi:Lar family restriction alleviation protein [Burkholderia gladioli]|uniref:Lar family restriction alleviation protein n=1 Tax=Burkholderia gladioli TaxID=28095 RepID=UPI00163EC941|nr:Lar family restriction alleviation protein [Burkholderia gladioli]
MSDKLSDCPFCGNEAETEKIEEGCYGVGCGYCDFQLMSGNIGIGWHATEAAAIAAWNRRASPTPAIPAYPAKHISLKMRRDRKIVLTLELDAVEGAPAYLLTPVNPCVVRAAPAISESEDAIHAVRVVLEQNAVYFARSTIEEIVAAARKGEKS